jgi:hypothetical protein
LAVLLGVVDQVFSVEQESAHVGGPGLVIVFMGEEEFAEVVSVAEAVVAAVIMEVGGPAIVDGAPGELGEDVNGVHVAARPRWGWT